MVVEVFQVFHICRVVVVVGQSGDVCQSGDGCLSASTLCRYEQRRGDSMRNDAA